ncbi:hypothetical protein PSAKC1_00029 [Pseudomonas phage PSA-KC1]
MADENIEIKVQDKVSPSISTKLRTIASEARNADAAVKNLQTQLSAINVGGLSQLINASASATRQLQQGALAAQRLGNRTAAHRKRRSASRSRSNARRHGCDRGATGKPTLPAPRSARRRPNSRRRQPRSA